MRLKKLTLSNFRGFEQIEIDFCDDFTVIAGVNGSGKSSLLRAISGIGSYLLPEITPAKKEAFSLAESDIYSGKLALSISTTFKTEKQILYGQILRSRSAKGNTSDLTEELTKLRVEKRFTEKGSKEEVLINDKMYNINQSLKESKDNFSWHSENDEVANPLIICYSTNRSLSRLSKQTSKVRPLTPANAYSNALQEIEVSLNEFANWYRACENGLLGDEATSLRLLKTLEAVIDTMMPSFSELLLVDKPTPHFTIKKNNTQFELDQLSEGERGILALAFDLTRRLTLANPQSQNPIEEGFALVMIDEIELHLHPQWQRNVLKRLTSIFKNCQFIVTTHSPQVIGQVPAENLRLLYIDKEEGKIRSITPRRSLGMDSSWILENIMDAPARDPDTALRLENIFNLIDQHDYLLAKQQIDALSKDRGGIFPDLQQAITLLNQLELLEGNEED